MGGLSAPLEWCLILDLEFSDFEVHGQTLGVHHHVKPSVNGQDYDL